MIKRTLLLIPSTVLLFATASAQAAVQPGYQSYNGVTNDVGPDLATVIEYDVTKQACDNYQADLDQYLVNNESTLSQLSAVEENLATLSEREQYIIDNFVDEYDRATVLQCGKYQYFYGHFDTTGAPKAMIDWMLQYFDDFFGPGMSYFGMYEDPNPVATIPAPASNPGIGSRQLPLGIAHSSGDFGTWNPEGDLIDAEGKSPEETARLKGLHENGAPVDVYAFTCSACHFKKMDDGNYAVGVGNTDYDYAKMTAAQGQLPLSVIFAGLGAPSAEPGLLGSLSDAVAASDAKYGVKAAYDAFMGAGGVNEIVESGALPSDFTTITSTPEEMKMNWATWPGVMDFLVRPMQDDGIHGMTRIMNTSAITTDEHVLKQHGLSQQQGLGWNGGGYDLIQFIRGFITITPSDPVTPESREEFNYWVKEYRYLPLVRYLESLEEPALPTDRTFDTAAAERGEAIFDANCTSCHSGPGGETPRPYDHSEVGVEDEHADIMAPVWDPEAYGGAGGWENGITLIAERFPAGVTGEVTRQVKAPRFISMWDNDRLLHNGSVAGLEALLACAQDRVSYAEPIPELVLDESGDPKLDSQGNTTYYTPTIEEHVEANPVFSNKGHEFGCHLSTEDKSDLIAFVETFSTTRDEGNKYNGQFESSCSTRNNGTSYAVNMTFTKGKRMELMTMHFSDDACQVFDTSRVNNPGVALSWEMQVGSTFVNSRGFESHNVTYTHPDGTVDEDVLALENGQLANATGGDPALLNMHVRQRTDYAGLNGRWLNDECTAENTRDMVVIQDGSRVDKTVTYNEPECAGGVLSVVNGSAWTFEDPKWLQVGTHATWSKSAPKYNMRMKMKPVDGGPAWVQFVNVTDNTFHAMFNNNFAASIHQDGQHYTRISNIMTAE